MLSCVWIQQLTYTLHIILSLRSGFVALFGWQETEPEGGCLMAKTILSDTSWAP